MAEQTARTQFYYYFLLFFFDWIQVEREVALFIEMLPTCHKKVLQLSVHFRFLFGLSECCSRCCCCYFCFVANANKSCSPKSKPITTTTTRKTSVTTTPCNKWRVKMFFAAWQWEIGVVIECDWVTECLYKVFISRQSCTLPTFPKKKKKICQAIWANSK